MLLDRRKLFADCVDPAGEPFLYYDTNIKQELFLDYGNATEKRRFLDYGDTAHCNPAQEQVFLLWELHLPCI
jgi:hypothetical protein